MYNNDKIISHLQTNKILALKLDHAVSDIGAQVASQVQTLGKGATRLLYYTSCFTDEYNDICQQQKTEDIRFAKGVYHILRREDIVCEMLNIYFSEIFRHRTSDQIDHIKQIVMTVNIHISASSLTNSGFALAVASSVAIGMSLSLEISALAGSWASRGIASIGIYGIVQKAADSAHRLQFMSPIYYAELYAQELEMMYFLIEPLFERAKAFNTQWISNVEIADIITKMIR